MTATQQFEQLSPAAREIITDYVRRRGIPSGGLDDFLSPKLDLNGSHLPQINNFVERIARAINGKERILIYGDYDADGICATSILLGCLRETAGVNPMWSLPNRQHDHYGLGLEKAESLYTQHHPTLLICLDNGINSQEAISWLKLRGVETLVIDHHPVESGLPDAVALINPKTCGGDAHDRCAAGLTLFVCCELAKQWKAMDAWNRDAAVMLAGIATLADAVRLSPANRALVKHAMELLGDANAVAKIPGLAALLADGNGKPSQRELQFGLIPALNAPGRIASAEVGVQLLTTHDQHQAKSLAQFCREQNEVRKQRQRLVENQAGEMAKTMLASHPEVPVLVLAHQNWHHGVVGPAASRLADQFQRSVVLLGPDNGDAWKGSGRAANGDHLGRWLAHAKSFGLVQRGGGHARAVGLALTGAQIGLLQTMGFWFDVPQTDPEPETEIIGEFDALHPQEWAQVLELLAPYGRGNPSPKISANNAECRAEAAPLTSNGNNQPWAMRAKFKSSQCQYFSATWRNVAAAKAQWIVGSRFDLILELTTTRQKGDKCFYNWMVRTCRPAAAAGGAKQLAASGGVSTARPDAPTPSR
jgi:single-stranded-DNA-specific exonuclease